MSEEHIQAARLLELLNDESEETGIEVEHAILVNNTDRTVTAGIQFIGPDGVPLFIGSGELRLLADYAEEEFYRIRPEFRP